MVTGTTCNVPVPPDLCTTVGGELTEMVRRSIDAIVICVVIFVPPRLVPTSGSRDAFIRYRRDVVEIVDRCLPEMADPSTDFIAVVSCVVSYLLAKYGQPPTVLIVSRAGLTEYYFGFGGIMSITRPLQDVKTYILPHLSLV